MLSNVSYRLTCFADYALLAYDKKIDAEKMNESLINDLKKALAINVSGG